MKRLSLALLLLVSSILLAACGGGPAAKDTIDVTFTDFKFTPNAFTIPAGKEITLSATNNGAVVHEFVVMKLETNVGDNFGGDDEGNIYWEVEVDPGGSKTETFTAPANPGEYQVVCGTPGHYMAGMIGKLIVVTP